MHRCGWIVGIVLSIAGLQAVVSGQPLDVRLVEAVQARDFEKAADLLEENVDVNVAQPDGATALHWAVRWGDLSTTEALIRAGASVDAANVYGVAPLSLAVTNGNGVVIEWLLSAGADQNRASPTGETPLMTAARIGQAEAVRLLLAHGASVDAAEPANGQTALMWAVGEGHVAAAGVLIDAGADVHARSRSGFTPLLFAVRDGRLDALRLLVAAGADVHDRLRSDLVRQTSRMDMGPDGSSAVALAILNAHYDIGVWLLEHGADADVSDPRGSLLHTLAWMRRPGKNAAPRLHRPAPSGEVGSLDLAKALLAHGADPNVRIAWEERTPGGGIATSFAYARSPGNMDTGISFMSYVGATPFYLAARAGDTALMRLLVANGANALTPTMKGITPLMAAAGVGYYNGHSPGPAWGVTDEEVLEALKLTWELGNDIHAVTDDELIPPEVSDPAWALDHPTGQFDLRWGRSTALHGAVLRESVPLVQFLVDKGARLDARNQLGWTPLSVAMGLFTGGTFRQYPETAELLRDLMVDRRLDVSSTIICSICGSDGVGASALAK
jgi:ankyrin repeat protein